MGTRDISFGNVVFNAALGHLTRDGAALSVSHRAIALLRALHAADGLPVSKSDLMEAAWSGQIVEEGNLTVQIAALRKAIGDDWIITVPRLGYRLLRPNAPEQVQTETIMLPSLAVLPFAN
jgi:DNA-binding winged helix-turn-helix (wHTH) protein